MCAIYHPGQNSIPPFVFPTILKSVSFVNTRRLWGCFQGTCIERDACQSFITGKDLRSTLDRHSILSTITSQQGYDLKSRCRQLLPRMSSIYDAGLRPRNSSSQNAIHRYTARANAVSVFSPLFDTKPISISDFLRELDIGPNHERHHWMLHSQIMHTSMNTLE